MQGFFIKLSDRTNEPVETNRLTCTIFNSYWGQGGIGGQGGGSGQGGGVGQGGQGVGSGSSKKGGEMRT